MSAQWYLWDLGGLLNITEEEPSCLAAIVAAMKVRQSADSDNDKKEMVKHIENPIPARKESQTPSERVWLP